MLNPFVSRFGWVRGARSTGGPSPTSARLWAPPAAMAKTLVNPAGRPVGVPQARRRPSDRWARLWEEQAAMAKGLGSVLATEKMDVPMYLLFCRRTPAPQIMGPRTYWVLPPCRFSISMKLRL